MDKEGTADITFFYRDTNVKMAAGQHLVKYHKNTLLPS